MWSRLHLRRLIIILLLLVAGAFTFYYVIRFVRIWIALTRMSSSTATPEEVFHRHILENHSSVPSVVMNLQGFDGTVLGYTGPAYIHFEASQQFLDETIKKGYLKPYIIIPCGDFFEASSKYAIRYLKDLKW